MNNLCFSVQLGPMNSAWDLAAECKCQMWWVWNAIQTHTKWVFGSDLFVCLRFTSRFVLFFFFFKPQLLIILSWTVYPYTVHGFYKLHFSTIFSLKMGSTALFTHLKIILLQYFQFSVFSFNKISFIQTELETF